MNNHINDLQCASFDKSNCILNGEHNNESCNDESYDNNEAHNNNELHDEFNNDMLDGDVSNDEFESESSDKSCT